MGKKVLILGNGFDLAHDLPTLYNNFLDFCERICKIYTNDFLVSLNEYICSDLVNWKINECVKNELIKSYKNRVYETVNTGTVSYIKDIKTSNKDFDKLYSCIKANIWYNYFSNNILYNCFEKNWIDFELEIKLCIKYIDEHSKYLSRSVKDLFESCTFIGDEDNAKLRYSAFKSAVLKNSENVNDVFGLRKVLYEDLEDITKALEIYLNLVETNKITQQYKDIADLNPDYIINFNYTHTYKNVYDTPAEIFYIHGEIDHDPNNMVLGIDEYWSEKERDSNTNFTIFKKFAQRIQKRTGIENYKWFNIIKSDYEKNNKAAEVFIFGHSLDITDKDILYDYLESEATLVTIYCKDKETEGKYIANVIKIIGEKRLLEKINQDPPKLKFVIQQPMIPIAKKEELLTSGAVT